MAQWHYHEELPTSLEKSNLDEYSSTGTSADSMYGSKTSGDSMYGSKTSGGSMYGSATYSQPDRRNAPFEGTGREHGDQGYKESSNEPGWTPPGQKYYDGASFQGRDREMDDQRYYDNRMLGRGSGMSGQGYDDSNVRGIRQGDMGQPTNGNSGGTGRGGRGRGCGGDVLRERESAKRGMLHGGDGGYGPAAKKPKWQQGETGSNEQKFGADQGWGGGGSGSRDSENSARGRGQGSRGRGFDGNTWGRGRGTGGQGSVSGTQGRGRGTMSRGRGGDTARGRGSAKRGMLQGGGGYEPAANKSKWQKEQQGKTGNSEQRWGTEQGWGRERIWGRGRAKDQGVRGRGSRGRQGGPPQRNNPGRSNQEFNDSPVEYGFDGKPVGPERLASTLGDFKYCKVCDIHINSMKSAKDHYAGKIHLKRLNSILQKEELMKTLDVFTDNCEVCNVVYTSPLQVKAHLDGNRHKKNVEDAKAKAEGRPISSESTDQKKQKKQKVAEETVTDFSRENASPGPSDEHLMLEPNEVEPKMKASDEMPRPADSQSHDQSHVAPKTFPEGALHTPNVREEQENVQSQKGERYATAAAREPEERMATFAGREPGERRKNRFYCDLCGISTTSPDLLADHFLGKKHKHTMLLIKKKKSASTTTHGSAFSCKLCRISTLDAYSLNLHKNGKRHLKNLELSMAADKPKPLMEPKSCPASQQEPKASGQVNEPPLPHPNEELFELEEQHPPEENAESQENQDDIDSAIVKSLQETTKDMPELKL